MAVISLHAYFIPKNGVPSSEEVITKLAPLAWVSQERLASYYLFNCSQKVRNNAGPVDFHGHILIVLHPLLYIGVC